MFYQSKTTVMQMTALPWTEGAEIDAGVHFHALHAAAVQVATLCHMDIMSISPYYALPDDETQASCHATVVYVNNGCSLADICEMTRPVENNRPDGCHWMISHIAKDQGMIECIVSVKGFRESW